MVHNEDKEKQKQIKQRCQRGGLADEGREMGTKELSDNRGEL